MLSKTDPPRRFRLAVKAVLIIAALAQSPILALYFPIRDLPAAWFLVVAALFQAAFMFVMGLSIGQVAVNIDGLTLNRINVLPWDQVERVTRSTVVGLRYVKAYRKGRKWAWWFPLNLADEDRFRRTVIELAPAGNPFRMFFETEERPRA